MITPAQAYWNQREALASSRERLLELSKAIAQPTDLWPYQGAQLMAFVLEFQPDLIIELGRGYGNSTCYFVEAAHRLGSNTKVLSLCISREWHTVTLPRLAPLVPPGWLERLDARRADIVRFPWREVLASPKRVAIFWDAHGFDVAECVLGGVLPLIAERPHVVMMHDLCDARHIDMKKANAAYADGGMWKGGNEGPRRIQIGHVVSGVEQAVSIVDFTTRNGVALRSADESMAELAPRADELRRAVGDEFFSVHANWFWFTLEGAPRPLTFPRFVPPPELVEPTVSMPLTRRLRVALNVLRGVDPRDLFPEWPRLPT